MVSETAMFGRVPIHFRPVHANAAMHDPISTRLGAREAIGDSGSPTHKLIGSRSGDPAHQVLPSVG